MDLNKRVPTLFAYGLCLEFFPDFSDFFFFLREVCGEVIYREYIVFRGSNIASLACGVTLTVCGESVVRDRVLFSSK